MPPCIFFAGNTKKGDSPLWGKGQMDTQNIPREAPLDPAIVEAMGISAAALEEVEGIVGRMPTVEELSTLLAMWEANGRQQSLLGWLRGQHHTVERHEYLYTDTDTTHKSIREPRVKDCIPLAHEVMRGLALPPLPPRQRLAQKRLLYMAGNVTTGFLDSEYARRCLHLASDPIHIENEDDEMAYLHMILSSLHAAKVINTFCPVGRGGLFATLARSSTRTAGFDILTCREVRLDAFLFGEEGGRYLVTLPEEQDDFFLLKMDEARVNCCFLGRTTKGRAVVDDMDYGPAEEYRGIENSKP